MFWRKKKVNTIQHVPTVVKPKIDMTKEASLEDVEIVSVITSAILSSDKINNTVKIKSVREVDYDKEAAVVIVSAVLANDKPNSIFKLKNIEEIGGE